jgi:hypothetical protein
MGTPSNSGAAQLDERSVRKIAGLSLVGASVEWFDFFLYGTAAALVFPKIFFPNADPATGVLLSFATFDVGFVARCPARAAAPGDQARHRPGPASPPPSVPKWPAATAGGLALPRGPRPGRVWRV